MAKKKGVTGRILHDPIEDRLTPIFPLDLSRMHTIDDLVRSMGQTAFTARQIGDAADVLEAMARDKDCFVVMTLSGAMTVGKMGLVFCDLVESGIVKAIVSTGALMAHGLVEATGRSHFRYNPHMDDRELFEAGYNRVYDSLEPEVNLDAVEEVMQHILSGWDAEEVVCSWKINRRIGEYLIRHAKGRGILKTCAEKNVPVFVPAFTDSELGIDFALHKRLRKKAGKAASALRPLRGFRALRLNHAQHRIAWGFSPSAAAFRETGPSNSASMRNFSRAAATKKFRSSAIATESASAPSRSTGAASPAAPTPKPSPGANLSRTEEGGRFAEVLDDATVALPLVVGAVLERLGHFKTAPQPKSKKR